MNKCPHCGGGLRQAFPGVAMYLSCRRCGHVFAGVSVEPSDEPTSACPDCEESPCHPECPSGGGL